MYKGVRSLTEGADRIIQRVLDDARARADSIKAEAAEKAKAAESEARHKAERKKEHILEHARKTAAEHKGRIIGVTQLETRKSLLAAKQEMIDEAFQKALNELTGLDESTYLSVIRDLLLNTVETGTETVICSERDQQRLNSKFIDGVNKALADRGQTGELKLSDKTRAIKGGFVLHRGGLEINCSFESLLRMKRDELENEVAGLLFG